jgi:hypothetical protein
MCERDSELEREGRREREREREENGKKCYKASLT